VRFQASRYTLSGSKFPNERGPRGNLYSDTFTEWYGTDFGVRHNPGEPELEPIGTKTEFSKLVSD